MTGGNFSKLAAVGGGLLFGLMGITIGTALTYKPAEVKIPQLEFSIDSDIKKIDDRNIILNFYSEMKKQFIDIELPQGIYNFLQTHLPEKKYGIVEAIEKEQVINNSVLINGTSGIGIDPNLNNKSLIVSQDSLKDFEIKVTKLKMMKEAGLLSDEELLAEKTKLLSMI